MLSQPRLSLCCVLAKALTLDPVPVIDNRVFICGAVGKPLEELCLRREDICELHINSIPSILANLAKGNSEAILSSRGDQQKKRHTSSVKAQLFIASEGVAFRKDLTKLLWAREYSLVERAYKWTMTLRRQNLPGCGLTVLIRLRKSDGLPPGLYLYSQPQPEIGTLLEVLEQNGVSVAESMPATLSIRVFPGTDPCSAMYIIKRKTEKTVPTEYSNRLYGETMFMGSIEHNVQPIGCDFLDIGLRNNQKYVVDLRWKAGDLLKDCISAVPKIRGLKAVVWRNDHDSYALEESIVAWIHGSMNPLDPRTTIIDYSAEQFDFAFRTEKVSRLDLPEPPDRMRSYFTHTYVEGDVDLASTVIGKLPNGSMRMGYPGNMNSFTWYEMSSLGVGCNPTPLSEGKPVPGVPASWSLLDTRTWKNIQPISGSHFLAVMHTLYYSCVNCEYSIMITHVLGFDQMLDKNIKRL